MPARSICLAIVLAVVLPALVQIDASADSGACPKIEVFHRAGCPHCERAFEFLHDLRAQHASVTIEAHDINESPEVRQRFIDLNQAFRIQRPGVPSFYICGDFLVGFNTAQTTGREILNLLGLQPAASDIPRASEVETGWFGKIDAIKIGLPLFTVIIGLIDGFNPCAMWVLLFLLSLLVHLRDRRRIVLIAGTFVLVSGIVYFAFMAAWLNLFLIVGVSRRLQIAVGLLAVGIGAVHVKDFFAFNKGLSLSIPDSTKPGIYAQVRRVINADNVAGALAGVAILAVLVNLIELVCTAGLPAVYTQILAIHDLDASSHYGYLFLYNVAYMLDDALMVAIAVYTLGHHKLGEKSGSWLKLISGSTITVLGVLLIFAPQLLF